MAHGDALEGKWRRNWRMAWVASTLHTTSEHGVCSITTADAHTSAASSRLNWRTRWFTWTRPFRRKTKSGFCPCAITFQLASTLDLIMKSYPTAHIRNRQDNPNGCLHTIAAIHKLTGIRTWMQTTRKAYLSKPHGECVTLISATFSNKLMPPVLV